MASSVRPCAIAPTHFARRAFFVDFFFVTGRADFFAFFAATLRTCFLPTFAAGRFFFAAARLTDFLLDFLAAGFLAGTAFLAGALRAVVFWTAAASVGFCFSGNDFAACFP